MNEIWPARPLISISISFVAPTVFLARALEVAGRLTDPNLLEPPAMVVWKAPARGGQAPDDDMLRAGPKLEGWS